MSCVNSQCVSVRSVGQTLFSPSPCDELSVLRDVAAAHADRQEGLSHQNRATSGLYFFSTCKFLAQVGAHVSREPRELEQIFQIAPRQIREE